MDIYRTIITQVEATTVIFNNCSHYLREMRGQSLVFWIPFVHGHVDVARDSIALLKKNYLSDFLPIDMILSIEDGMRNVW